MALYIFKCCISFFILVFNIKISDNSTFVEVKLKYTTESDIHCIYPINNLYSHNITN